MISNNSLHVFDTHFGKKRFPKVTSMKILDIKKIIVFFFVKLLSSTFVSF